MKAFARQASLLVYNAVLSMVQNKEDAEEVVQDTILAALSGISNFKGNANIKTWVYSIALNKSRDFLKYKSRTKRKAKLISLVNEKDGSQFEHLTVNFRHPGILIEQQEQMDLLFFGINQLPETQKTVLVLTKLDQKSIKEVAEIIGSSPKAVESLLSRAKSNFKQFLEKEGIEMYKNKTQKK